MDTTTVTLRYAYLGHGPPADIQRRASWITEKALTDGGEITAFYIESQSHGRSACNHLLGALMASRCADVRLIVYVTSDQDLGANPYARQWAMQAFKHHEADVVSAQFPLTTHEAPDSTPRLVPHCRPPSS
jgi:hypothetical protein